MTDEQKPQAVLRYIGGGRFLPGVPARDLTDDDLAALKEADQLAGAEFTERLEALPKGAMPPDAPTLRDRKALVKSGLYEPVAPAKGG